MSLARQFLLASVPLTVVVLALVGHEVGERIEASVVDRTAGIAAVYFESMLARRLDEVASGGGLSDDTRRMLDDVFVHGPLAQRVVRFKLWAPDGRIHYSSDHTQDGMQFPLHDHHAIALSGRTLAAISELDGPDNAPERARWSRLVEIYLPVRAPGSDSVTAVAEFYHEVDSVDAEIARARRQSWITIALAAMLVYALLYGLVVRASRTIVLQRSELALQVRRLEQSLAENRRVHRRLQQAGARSTALAELSLRRIAADLHDGPVQDLALALLRLDHAVRDESLADPLRASLQGAMQQLRDIASGLAAPSMAPRTLAEALRQAVADACRHQGCSVASEIAGDLPNDVPEAVKLTAYRVVREALANALRHAAGHPPRLLARREGEWLWLEVSDDGPGFDPTLPAAEGHLGLALLRERVQLISGSLSLRSAPGRGTTLRVQLPLAPPLGADAADAGHASQPDGSADA